MGTERVCGWGMVDGERRVLGAGLTKRQRVVVPSCEAALRQEKMWSALCSALCTQDPRPQAWLAPAGRDSPLSLFVLQDLGLAVLLTLISIELRGN